MIWIPYKNNKPTWLPLSSSKGSSSWLSWIVFYQGIPLFRRTCKTQRCTKTQFEGSILGPRSYYTKTYFVALLLTIPQLSLHFLQVFWLGSKTKLTDRTIWSLHPVYFPGKQGMVYTCPLLWTNANGWFFIETKIFQARKTP